MGLSTLGIFHTAIGVTAIISATLSYIRYGKINLSVLSGKVYALTTVITSLTALGISKHGGFTPGHAFSVFILILVLAACFTHVKKTGNNRNRYLENFLLSFSFFLSWIPTINETFTRVPIGKPLARHPGDPIIAKTLTILLVLFLAGSVFQFVKQRKVNKPGV